MARRRTVTGQLYRLARASDTMRAASQGPAAYAKRQVRRRVYRKSGSLTRALLKAFGLSR